MRLLTVNAGSSGIKIAVFAAIPSGAPRLLLRGALEDGDGRATWTLADADGVTFDEGSAPPGTSLHRLVETVLGRIALRFPNEPLSAAGHRIVHGGRAFAEPVRIDPAVREALQRLVPLAPLHQPRCLEPIAVLDACRPGLAQVACFDTAFHHGLEPPASRYGLPRRFEDEGLRKYGFHGLSYEHVADRLARIDGAAEKRTVVAHLGNGASLCAMRHGRSLDTTMGYSVLDGLVMGTRCGALDPGLVLALARTMTPDAVEDLLYRQSGLLGVSGLSSDMRVLCASTDARAKEAIDLFTFRIARETAALAATMQGLDALVFTGGIGEHAAPIRAAVCARLGWLGVTLANNADVGPHGLISTPDSTVTVRVIPADEEMTIARHTLAVLEEAAPEQA